MRIYGFHQNVAFPCSNLVTISFFGNSQKDDMTDGLFCPFVAVSALANAGNDSVRNQSAYLR